MPSYTSWYLVDNFSDVALAKPLYYMWSAWQEIYNIRRNIVVSTVNADGLAMLGTKHDDVIKWKHFPRNLPFVRGIHRSPVNFPHRGQWRGALMFSLICVWINGWVNNREAGDLRRYRAHYGVIVMNNCKWTDNKFHSLVPALMSGETMAAILQ